ncbi:ComF family protein [Chitinimonas koreensis]|uniref:ComF family protein n=2 Tax=Chitinimonas koreensis TaxID=356302 RepID=UPI0012FC4FE7|nr:ComF family protein [Chitinimonas koreensis]
MNRSKRARLLDLLLPQACLLCAADAAADGWCAGCRAELPWLTTSRCPVCALPTPQGERCGACLRSPPAYAATVAAWAYRWPLDRLIPAFKYGHDLALAHPLADGLARAAATAERPELLVAMPLHPARLRERGFNQSQLLAQRLATALGLPLDRHAVRRIKDTPPQASLPWDERRRSIRGAFAVADGLAGRHVALVDDVMTTGASLDELARSLLAAGAVRVDCWVAARALRD